MQIAKGEKRELLISDLAFGGSGLGKIKTADGDLAVFVENTVPGDLIEAEFVKIKKNYAIGRKIREIELSKLRVKPRCKHFGECGGCSLQFLPYETQLQYKEKYVKENLEHIAGIKNPPMLPIISCQHPWFYRNKIEYSFENADGKIKMGFHHPRRYREVCDIEECFLQSAKSVEIAMTIKKWLQKEKICPSNLIIREAKTTGEIMVNLVFDDLSLRERSNFKNFLLNKFKKISSLYITIITKQKGSRTKINETLIAGKQSLTEILRVPYENKFITLIFDILPSAFFQTNTKQAEILYGKILEFAKPGKKDVVIDLFCGTGTIGMFFAKTAKQVYGIDNNESAIKNAKENAEKNNIKNISFVCGDVYKFISDIKDKPDILVADPPRAGIPKKALEKILEISPRKIIYISCNPPTLSRDLKELVKFYELKTIQPIDMFPQTYHIETICLLCKPKLNLN